MDVLPFSPLHAAPHRAVHLPYEYWILIHTSLNDTKPCRSRNSLLIAILIPFVLELRHGPLLVMPQAMARRSLTPSLINALTLVRGFRHCRQ